MLLNAEDQAMEFCASLEGRQLKSAVNLETDAPMEFTVNAGYTILRYTLDAQDAIGIYFEEQAA